MTTTHDETDTGVVMVGDEQAPAAARRIVRERLTGTAVPQAYAEDAELVVSELVTNAYRYGCEPGDSLRVAVEVNERSVWVEVQDPCRRYPRPRPASDERGKGRGLYLVNALSTAWGVDDRPMGKAVWAVLAW